MAALVLSVAGAAVGSVFGPIGAIAGRIAGAVAGNLIDHALLGGGNDRTVEGPRLADLDLMASTEGAPIPRVYGRVRLSGQVIWATDIEEVVSTTTETTGGKGMGASSTTTTTTYTYYANIAVGLCEGPIGRVGRIWADGNLLDLDGLVVRTHTGSEDQAADPLIVAKEAGGAPAYRGLAYVVFERLPLAPFGNRIPQLSFEVLRPVGALERMVRAVTLIPGTTEFGYEPSTVVQARGRGASSPENRHVTTAPSDVEVALDELAAVCPDLERVALVVAWFGDDLRAGVCRVRPGVDDATKVTHPATWSVAGLSRAEAHLVSQIDGRPAYGGTPSDDSVIHLITLLKARGWKVTLYPFVMMDIPAGNGRPDPWSDAGSQPVHPWRGRITCDPAPGRPGSPDGTAAAQAQIDAFFGTGSSSADDYRKLVLHCASLAVAAGGVDAFLIGSELRSLTRVRSATGVYPAVEALVTLAAEVKAVLGASTLVTYGADWTEYGAHVVDEAATEIRFPLDRLWGSTAIDAIGIDDYAPLSDWRDGADHLDRALADTPYDRAYLAANVRAGEAFDWYYADDAAREKQARTPITDGLEKPWVHRAKDFWNFWSNPHHERVGGVELSTPTAWVPQSKPIWLTEAGCPAVDKGANQPSVFPDTKSSESGTPWFSNGRRDDVIQRRSLEAVLTAFDPALGATAGNPISTVYGGPMVEPSAIHLWTWDARPFPMFPAATEVWSEGPNWETGHWLTGRLGACPLDGLIAQIVADAGVTGVDTSALADTLDGYLIDRPMTPRAAIEPLAQAYAFDAVADGATLVFRHRGGLPVVEIVEDDLITSDSGASSKLVRAQETELPAAVAIGFTDLATDYRRAAVQSRKLVGGSAAVSQVDLAAVITRSAATRRAEILLQDAWASRESATFALPPSRLALVPGDVIGFTVAGRRRLVEVRELVDAAARSVTARAIDPEVFSLPLPRLSWSAPVMAASAGPPHLVVMALPTLPGDADDAPVLLRAAVFADPWPGPIAIWRSFDGAYFERIAVMPAPAVTGETLDPLYSGPAGRFDVINRFRVRLDGGALASVSDEALFAGANAAVVQRPDGVCEVLQFATAELVDERTYMLSRFLRGQAGSEYAMADPVPPGASFVRLGEAVTPLVRGLENLGRAIELRAVAADRSHGDTSATVLHVTPDATAAKPLAPAHVRGRRTAEGVVIRWVRRTRHDGDSWEISEVPLGESVEAYEVDILSGDTVLRTLASTTPNALYSVASEVADFGEPQAALAVRVYQLSGTVGRGFPAAVTLWL